MRSPRAEGAPALAGRYRVIRQLGSGGMASVMLAEDERLGRLVAVKRLPTSSPEDALARFRREARLGASLNHPNVVSIYDSTTDEDSLLIVMEYVEGESLKEKLRRGPLPAEEVVAIVTQIGAALDYAHAAGVIHRDVKPSNVLIAGDGTAKLADLGIATAIDATKITTTNDIIGTLSYIAPERLENAADHPSADVYSLAAVAFEALCGQRPQPGQTPAEIVTGSARDLREVWAQAPAAVADALGDGLARDPGRRPETAGALADRLSAAITGEGAPVATAPEATTRIAAAPPAGPPPAAEPRGPSGGWWSRRRAAVAGGLATALGVIAAIALLGGSDEPRDVRVKTQTRTVTTEPEPPPEPEPLTGAALGRQLNDEGKALIDSGNAEEAIPVLQEAVEAFPEGTTDVYYAYALYNLGNALRLAGRPEEAIPVLEQRLEIPNQRGVVAEELALAQEQAGVSSSGGVAPEEGESSGGVKPGKGPKPGRGHKDDDEFDDD